MSLKSGKRVVAVLAVAVLAACADSNVPSGPNDIGPFGQSSVANLPPQAQRAQWFAQASPEVLALDQTVYADDDEATGQLVFGVEHAGVGNRVRGVLARYGIPASAYRIEEVEPIVNMASLQGLFESKVGGIQIHFGQFVCTLGFNVAVGSVRSFITNSHCTNKQGGTEGTVYYQPLQSVSSTAIATEVDDPSYSKDLPGCSRGKVCRYSDASRAEYASGIASSLGAIAVTASVNSGSLDAVGTVNIASETDDQTFSNGTVVNKVGRTTGWTSGQVVGSCVKVNVSGSNVQQLCQTLVQNNNAVIVDGGDSGSPVFIGSSGNVTLAGILWGGSTDNHLFVFSPLRNVKNELGDFSAGGTVIGGGDTGGDDPGPCVPKGPKGNNCK
jgi:hypothetical protein